MSRASTLTSWARVVRRTLLDAGCDADALFHQAGLDPALLSDARARYPLAGTAALWGLAAQATGNPAVGLAVARRAQATSFHALGFAVMASPRMVDALDRCARYLAVVSDAARLRLLERGATLELFIEAHDPAVPPVPEAVDAIAAVLVQLLRARLGRDYAPLQLMLQRAAPADASPWQRCFRCPLAFGESHNRLCLPAAPLHQALDSGSAELADANEALVQQLLAAREPEALSSRVRRLLAERLPQGEPAEAEIAAALHLSPRSLHRRLAEEGSRYGELLRHTRETLARRHLAEGRHSVSEVAYLLGFADASSFSRAFKRWTGQAPARWRP